MSVLFKEHSRSLKTVMTATRILCLLFNSSQAVKADMQTVSSLCKKKKALSNNAVKSTVREGATEWSSFTQA